jgi:hypothetical protein
MYDEEMQKNSKSLKDFIEYRKKINIVTVTDLICVGVSDRGRSKVNFLQEVLKDAR